MTSSLELMLEDLIEMICTKAQYNVKSIKFEEHRDLKQVLSRSSGGKRT